MSDYRVSACEDCVMVFAGFAPDEAPCIPADQWERITARWSDTPGWPDATLVCDGEDDDYGPQAHFGRWCDVCGTDMGGNRYNGTLIFWERKKHDSNN